MARFLFLALFAFPLALAPAQDDDDTGADAAFEDPRTSEEILAEILLKRDHVDPVLFEVLGRRQDAAALGALQQASMAVFATGALEKAFSAFRHFRDTSLEAQTLVFLARESLAGYPYKQRAAVYALVEFGNAAIPRLENVFEENADVVCKQIAVGGLVTKLRTQGDEDALGDLIEYYRHPTSGSRELGVRTFAAFENEDSLDLFEDALRSKKIPVQTKTMIVEAVGRMKVEGSLDLLIDALRAKGPPLQLAAIEALSARGHTGHLRELERLERARDPALKRAAFVAQAQFRPEDEAWVKKVRSAAKSRDYALRMGAAVALGRMRDPESIGLLHGLLEDENHLVRREAIDAVGRKRHKDSVPILIARLELETLRLRHRLRATLEILTGLDHGPTPVRWSAWWEAEGAAFAIPALDQALAAKLEREQRRLDNFTQADFYGIPVRSDRVCFVLDVSGSMDMRNEQQETRLDIVKRELSKTLEGFPDGGRFNLIFFADRAQAWKSSLVEMDAARRKGSTRHVTQQNANGGTALHDGLVKAFDDPDVDTIFLLSDGEPTAGKMTDPLQILQDIVQRNAVRKVVIHTISVNFMSRLMEDLAKQTGGVHRQVF